MGVQHCDHDASIEDWVNQGRILASHGELPAVEDTKEALKQCVQQQLQMYIGDTWEYMLNEMGYSDSFDGETLYVFSSMFQFALHAIKQHGQRLRSSGQIPDV